MKDAKKAARLANLMFAVVLLGAVAMTVIGIILEKQTPEGRVPGMRANGFWAVCALIPASGIYACLANWVIMKKYKSRSVFSWVCFALTVAVFFLFGYFVFRHFHLMLLFHPKFFLFMLKRRWKVFIVGSVLSISIFVCSKVLSSLYAKLKGME